MKTYTAKASTMLFKTASATLMLRIVLCKPAILSSSATGCIDRKELRRSPSLPLCMGGQHSISRAGWHCELHPSSQEAGGNACYLRFQLPSQQPWLAGKGPEGCKEDQGLQR